MDKRDLDREQKENKVTFETIKEAELKMTISFSVTTLNQKK
jgi:hypothetical protein